MLDFFRDRLSAEEVLDYLEHLPRTSAYHSAVANDEDLARQVMASDEVPKASKAPPLTEFSPEVAALAEIRDVLAQTLNVLVKVNNGKPSPFRPFPRPETAVDKALKSARDRVRFQHHQSLTKRLLPRT